MRRSVFFCAPREVSHRPSEALLAECTGSNWRVPAAMAGMSERAGI